jgi:outer membrane porin, OprD family
MAKAGSRISLRLMLAFAMAGAAGAAMAQEATGSFDDELHRALLRDYTLTLQLRTYWLDKENPAPPDNQAWAGGGWLDYQSDWIYDTVKIGAVGYTSQPIYAPEDEDGTRLLQPGQQGYSVLGQAYVAFKLNGQVLTGFRQSINQPEVNPQDNRMTPNTFEAVTVTGDLGMVDYFGGYVWGMKPRDADAFFDMAEVAGVQGVDEPMWLGGLGIDIAPDARLRASAYTVTNVLASSYFDGTWKIPLAENIAFRISGQFMYQQSDGDLLTGTQFNTWSGGVKGDWIVDWLTVSLAYTQTGDANYQAPYGSWPGYTSMIVKDFNRANESAFLVGGTVDFSGVGLTGLSFTAYAVFGDNAINAATGDPVSDNTEYDYTLDYSFASFEDEAAWIAPLRLRARYGRVDQELNGANSPIDDYRIIANYAWKLK